MNQALSLVCGVHYLAFGILFRLNDGSRMNGDVHVRFYESLGVKFPGATHPADYCYSLGLEL